MVLKLIDATEAKVGVNIIVEGEPSTVKKVDISKTGKHGSHKCRIEAVGMLTGNKRVFVAPGHDRFEVPNVDKRRGQVLTINEEKVSLMDSESFETLELAVDPEVKAELVENCTVEYWDIEGSKIVKRKM